MSLIQTLAVLTGLTGLPATPVYTNTLQEQSVVSKPNLLPVNIPPRFDTGTERVRVRVICIYVTGESTLCGVLIGEISDDYIPSACVLVKFGAYKEVPICGVVDQRY